MVTFSAGINFCRVIKSSANLKLKFFLKDRSNDFKLSSVSDGVTINLKKGDKPMIINLSSDKLSNQKLINISNLFLIDVSDKIGIKTVW